MASGAVVQAGLTTPGEGILRIQLHPESQRSKSALLVEDVPSEPLGISAGAGGVLLAGGGVDASWSVDGLSAGLLEPPGPATPFHPALAKTSGGKGEDGWLFSFGLSPESRIYGGGESYQGPDLRGRIRRMVNCELHAQTGLDLAYLNVPFIWSDAGWGLFFHTSAPVRADLGATYSEMGAVAIEGPFDLFVITGTPPEILSRYQRLTGLPGRFPDWGLGVWMSRCSYLSADQIDKVIDELEAAQCPIDVIHVDGWMKGNVLRELACNWEVDRSRFPQGWARTLSGRGVRTSLWHNPYVLEGTDLAEELDTSDMLAQLPEGSPGRTGDKQDRFVIDFTEPAAVEWWKSSIRTLASSEAVDAFKPDFAEEVPELATFADGRKGRALRNEYALLYQRATHEVMSDLADDGVALFCRSGTAGSQRYPCHWVGDSASTWSGMVSALRACLSLSLSGFGFVSHDIGGFWSPTSFNNDELVGAFDRMDDGYFTADVEPELFARWSQWGALSPVMRFHGTGRREPTAYAEPARSAAIFACRFRESLQGYLSLASREATEVGTPMMRPMVLAYPNDPSAVSAELQYLLGPDILVAPILAAGGKRSFYVPGGDWLPLYGLETQSGPGWVTVQCSLEQFPAFVRAGAPWPLEGP